MTVGVRSMIAGSIVVVSRHRPQALARCIASLRQQTYPQLELIIVADPAACAGLAGIADIKIIAFDQANISAARNLGLAQSAGEVVLFIDDDAVAEPSWAAQLIAPFDAPQVVAATGFVRGRNGISFQWRACLVDHLGQDHPLAVPDEPSLHNGTAQLAVKTQGTNCAFRCTDLRAIGGFDPAFAFYLDEADVNLRLAARGATAVVPMAQVHHGYLASARRSADRVPTSLMDIAASTAVFLRKHAGDLDAGREALMAQQTRRIAALQKARKIDAVGGQRLLCSLFEGWEKGLTRAFGVSQTWAAAGKFLPLQGVGPRPSRIIAGRFFSSSALHRTAAQAVAEGCVVTVFCLSPSLRRHRMQFLPQGYWWQSGGIWGRSDRDRPAQLWCGFGGRIAAETRRIAPFR